MKPFVVLLLALCLPAPASEKIPFIVKKVKVQELEVTVLQPVFPIYFEVWEAEKLGLSKGEAVTCEVVKYEKKVMPKSEDQIFDLDCGNKGKIQLRRIFLETTR